MQKTKTKTKIKRKTKTKVKRVRFLGGAQCDGHASLFPKDTMINNKIMGGNNTRRRKRKSKKHKKKGGSFSNLITNLVNPITYTTTSPTDQPAIINYYATNLPKI